GYELDVGESINCPECSIELKVTGNDTISVSVAPEEESAQALHSRLLVLVDVEHGQESRDVQRLLDARALVQDLQGGAQVARRLEPGHQLTQARAVHEGDLREVEQDLLPVLAQELVDRL